MNKKQRSPRYFVEAAAKALGILETFTRDEQELSIAEAARRCRMTYSSAFRILYTLEKRGYVRRSPGKKSYRIVHSPKTLRIAHARMMF